MTLNNSQNSIDKILLLCKKPGLTSFRSLSQVKKAIHSTKVGHTGTLDSFASGLLVVCCGRLTKLAGHITGFDKSYDAVIEFGTETDTLEFTGKTVYESALPELEELKNSIKKWTGEIDQVPPAFSALHFDGKRSSDLVRKGISVELPSRKVTVYSAELKDYLLVNEKVKYALISFTVSKGTYIRSLARDIGRDCKSAAHLVGLFRTSVGSFNVKDACFYNKIPDFTIENVLAVKNNYLEIENESNEKKPFLEEDLQEINNGMTSFTPEIAVQCGMETITLKEEGKEEFLHGRSLKSKNFTRDLHELPVLSETAVFDLENNFYGVIKKDEEGRVSYAFVLN